METKILSWFTCVLSSIFYVIRKSCLVIEINPQQKANMYFFDLNSGMWIFAAIATIVFNGKEGTTLFA